VLCYWLACCIYTTSRAKART